MLRLNIKQVRRREEEEAVVALHAFTTAAMGIFRLYLFITSTTRRPEPRPELSPNPNFYQMHVNNINRLIRGNDTDCHDQLRVNRHTFLRLCFLVRGVGLGDSRNVCLEERVAIFLWVLGHHTKQRRTKYDFWRSIETVSRHFNDVLLAVLRLYNMLLVTPEPVPPNYEDSRWSWFQNYLRALDGTYVPVNPPAADRLRYRLRKGEIATNILGVCTRNQKFVYVLSGWEGSATDSRIFQNAIERPEGLIVPHGHYYLVDAGYTNGNGFLVPYRGQRYHINIWRQGHMPVSKEEYFNMKHSAARNVIERSFGVLKMRFAILRSASYYPIRTQTRIVTACCLLHNLIKREMPNDPIEQEYSAWEQDHVNDVPNDEHIDNVDSSNEWTVGRDALAAAMYNHWLANDIVVIAYFLSV
ncbi:protein ALP1-like [Rhododendron vialii]|uniref:protein ALP1-like n=1 Tax=Rhododendron vialii TaxID=182163 RepID=UPI00265FAC52|nr:protein ALP1-like [Rhododendron vialii]